jgi:hypothetical protein
MQGMPTASGFLDGGEHHKPEPVDARLAYVDCRQRLQ